VRRLAGCLVRLLLALALLPLMAAMPPLVYFFFLWMVFTNWFYRKEDR
jgi:hypothetical protein